MANNIFHGMLRPTSMSLGVPERWVLVVPGTPDYLAGMYGSAEFSPFAHDPGKAEVGRTSPYTSAPGRYNSLV